MRSYLDEAYADGAADAQAKIVAMIQRVCDRNRIGEGHYWVQLRPEIRDVLAMLMDAIERGEHDKTGM